MFIISDRVKETSITTGTGDVVLNGAYGSFQTFNTGIGDGNTTYYTIENNSRWEVGQGVYTASSNSISRDVVFDSSTGGSKITLEGVSTVFCTLPASRAFIEDPDGGVQVVDIVSTRDGNIKDLTVDTIFVSGDSNLQGSLSVNGDTVVGGDTLVSGDLSVLGDLDLNLGGDIDADEITAKFLTLIRPNSAGNFFHAYKDDGTNQTVSLWVDANVSPLWRLGLKTNPLDQTATPTFGYIFGRDGSVGSVSDTSNYFSIANTLGFSVQHQGNLIFRASSDTGVYIDNQSPLYPALTVQGALLNVSDLQRWEDSLGTTLSVIDSGGKIGILTDSPIYELDVDGSGRMDSVTLTSGIYFPDGTFQNTALTVSSTDLDAVSGIAVYASGQVDQNSSDIITVSGLLYDDSSISGYIDLQDAAVSGWAQAYVDSQDHSATAVSGWAGSYADAGDAAVSGWADSTMTSRDNAVSGWAGSYADAGDAAVSGWADNTFNLQEVTDRGSNTTNSIFTSGNITATSGYFDTFDMTLLGNGSQPPHLEGRLFYDNENHTLSLYNDEADVTLQLGQEQFLRVRNNTGATITNGTAVLITGSHGNAAPTISGAIATSESLSQIVGLATHNIEDSSFGYVTTYGIVRNVDTSHYSTGDEIFLSATQIGSGVNVSPTIPNYKVTIGHVIRSHGSNGSVLVQVGNAKLGGGDLKSEAELNLSGVPFVTAISDTTAGGSQTDPLFIFDSGNRQLQLGSGLQLLEGVPTNTTNVLYNNSGTLTFNGSAVGGSSTRTYNNITADFSMSDSSDVVFMDTTSGPINVYVPTAAGQGGKEIMVKLKAGSNSGVLVGSGSQTIDGQSQIAVYNTYESITLISDNSNWFIS